MTSEIIFIAGIIMLMVNIQVLTSDEKEISD